VAINGYRRRRTTVSESRVVLGENAISDWRAISSAIVSPKVLEIY